MKEIIKALIYDNIKNKSLIEIKRFKFSELDSFIENYDSNYIKLYRYSNYIGFIDKKQKFLRKGILSMNANNLVIIRGYGDLDPNICTFYKKTAGKDAVKIIENYLATQTEFDSSTYSFQVRNADDSNHLYSYYKGKIIKKEANKIK